MNGVHDMGGMHGMGPVQPEQDEPVFHHRWEARVFALARAMGRFGRWNIDAQRHQRELIPAADQLRMSYYERWLEGSRSSWSGTPSSAQKSSRPAGPRPARRKLTPALPADKVSAFIAGGSPASREYRARPPRFRPGQRVRARNLNPTGHTRLPSLRAREDGHCRSRARCIRVPRHECALSWAKARSTCTPSDSGRESCGVRLRHRQDSVYVDLWEDYLDAV